MGLRESSGRPGLLRLISNSIPHFVHVHSVVSTGFGFGMVLPYWKQFPGTLACLSTVTGTQLANPTAGSHPFAFFAKGGHFGIREPGNMRSVCNRFSFFRLLSIDSNAIRGLDNPSSEKF